VITLDDSSILINLNTLTYVITTTTLVIGAIWKFFVPLKNLMLRFVKIERWTSKQQKDIEATQRDIVFILKGVLVCLEGLERNGLNGEVKESIKAIKHHLIEQRTVGHSFQSEE